jgi:hypothetical protein
MTEAEMRQAVIARTAILSELNRIGLRVIEGCEDEVAKWFSDKGVTTSVANGFLEMKQADGGDVVPSRALVTLRTARPELFASSPKYDKISSREDLNRGTPSEISKAKSDFIKEFGLSVFEKLPKTRAEATLKSCEVGPGMTRKDQDSPVSSALKP